MIEKRRKLEERERGVTLLSTRDWVTLHGTADAEPMDGSKFPKPKGVCSVRLR